MFDASRVRAVKAWLTASEAEYHIPLPPLPKLIAYSTEHLNQIHELYVNNKLVRTITPLQETGSIDIPIEQGVNDILVVVDGQTVGRLRLIADPAWTWLHALGREMWSTYLLPLLELQTALAGTLSTRLSSHFLNAGDVLPTDVLARIVADRQLLAALLDTNPAASRVVETAKAISASTPLVIRDRAVDVGPLPANRTIANDWMSTTHEHDGRSLHVWTANINTARKLALLAWLQALAGDSADPAYRLLSFDDYGLRVQSRDGAIDQLSIDPYDLRAWQSAAEDYACLLGGTITYESHEVISSMITDPALRLDSAVSEPIVTAIDVYGGNWLGTHIRFFDSTFALDSRVQPTRRAAEDKVFVPVDVLSASTTMQICAKNWVLEPGHVLVFNGLRYPVLSAKPLFDYVRAGAVCTWQRQVAPAEPAYILQAAAGTFTLDLVGHGARVAGTGDVSIDLDWIVAGVSEDGTTAYVCGHESAAPGPIAGTVQIFQPITTTDEAGVIRPTYELTFAATTLPAISGGIEVEYVRPVMIHEAQIATDTQLRLWSRSAVFVGDTVRFESGDEVVVTDLTDEPSQVDSGYTDRWLRDLTVTALPAPVAERGLIRSVRRKPKSSPASVLQTLKLRAADWIIANP